MTDFVKSQFRFMLAYRFKNEHGFVKTAWLDTFDIRFKNKSGTQTYTLYQRVASQYYNYQITLTYSNSQSNRINSIIKKLLQSYTFKPGFTQFMLKIVVEDYLNKFNDSNKKYSENNYEPLIYIRYQLDDFNKFVKDLGDILNFKLIYPQPRHFIETKNINPKPIETWYERNPIITHRKGYRGFVRDYEYIAHW